MYYTYLIYIMYIHTYVIDDYLFINIENYNQTICLPDR